MSVSYIGLWKLLIDNGMKKQDLVEKVGISSATVAKMGRNEPVSIKVIDRICDYFGCEASYIMSIK